MKAQAIQKQTCKIINSVSHAILSLGILILYTVCAWQEPIEMGWIHERLQGDISPSHFPLMSPDTEYINTNWAFSTFIFKESGARHAERYFTGILPMAQLDSNELNPSSGNLQLKSWCLTCGFQLLSTATICLIDFFWVTCHCHW